MLATPATTMFQFHLETMEKPLPGIYGTQVFSADVGEIILALALGRTKPVELSDGVKTMAPYDDFHASKMIWASRDEVPFTVGKKFMGGYFARGRKIYIKDSSAGSRMLSLQTKTGLFGNDEVKAALLSQMPIDPTDSRNMRRVIDVHGFYAMDRVEGAEHILEAEYDLDDAVRHIQGQSFGYHRMVPTELGMMRVYSQRTDAFNTKPGAQLLGKGCVPGVICRLIHDEKVGYVLERYDIATDVGKRWCRAFLETAWKTAEANRERREARRVGSSNTSA